MNSIDEKLVNEVAKVWVDGGGDRDGIWYLVNQIAARVQEIIDENNETN